MDETPTVLAAFGAGALSIASAAVAPLLPGFAGYIWNRGLAQLAGFLLGFSLIFVALGAGATSVGQALLEQLTLAERAAGVTLTALGIRDMRAAWSRGPSPETGAPERATASTVTAAFVAGAALMFGWTPVAGVVLNRILAIATSADTIEHGLSLLAVNAAGRALPLAALALALGATLQRAAAAGSSRDTIQLISAGAVTLSGLLIVSGLFPSIAAALVPLLPLA